MPTTPDSDWLADHYPALSGVRLNVRLDAQGNWPTKPNSQPDNFDVKLINHLRSRADVIVTGANTALANGYKPSKWAPIVVIGRSIAALNLPLFQDPDAMHQPMLWLADCQTSAATDSRLLQIDQSVDLHTAVISQLHSLGYSRILLETGPTLSRLLEPALDEICLTSDVNAQVAELLNSLTARTSQLMHEHQIDGQTFSRWSILTR